MNSRKTAFIVFGLCIAWLLYRGFAKGWTVSEVVPLTAIIVVFAASFMEVSHMGLFGKSEYEKQLEVSAQQQTETARQLEITERQQGITERQQGIAEQQQREHEELMARSREHQERYAKLLDTWEEQTRRFEAILCKWEQKS